MFFVDAAHFVLGSFLGWLWCAGRLFVRGASGRQGTNRRAVVTNRAGATVRGNGVRVIAEDRYRRIDDPDHACARQRRLPTL